MVFNDINERLFLMPFFPMLIKCFGRKFKRSSLIGPALEHFIDDPVFDGRITVIH